MVPNKCRNMHELQFEVKYQPICITLLIKHCKANNV